MISTGLVILALAAAARPALSQETTVTGNSVILKCPGNEPFSWYDDKDTDLKQTTQTYEVPAQYGMVNGEYRCGYTTDDDSAKSVKHLFFLNVKVCDNCYELSTFMAAAVIFGDLLITGAVILIVYMCLPKKTGSNQQKASKPRTQSAPPVPNPDYERLNQRTRTTDVYSALK